MTNAYYHSLVTNAGSEPNIIAKASTHEMVRSLVGAGIGCAILNMVPATSTTYGGDRVKAIPVSSRAQSLKLVLGHIPGKPRRLVEAFAEATKAHFARPDAKLLIVVN